MRGVKLNEMQGTVNPLTELGRRMAKRFTS
jgi:hypothetical protein